MDILRKACWIFFLLFISITAIEALTSYVGVKFMGVSEIGYARIWVYSYGPELGFTIAFLWVSSLPFVFLFLSLLFLHLTRRSSWFGIAFYVPFIELGATSLWNLPAAVNDAMIVLYGTSTTILFPWENVLISFGAFVAVSLYFYVLWKHPPQWWEKIGYGQSTLTDDRIDIEQRRDARCLRTFLQERVSQQKSVTKAS